MSRRPTQCDVILNLLLAARGAEVSAYELAQHALRYDARVSELRQLGYKIVSRVEHRDGKVYGFFRLDPSSVTDARRLQLANSPKSPDRTSARKSSSIAQPSTPKTTAESSMSLFGDLRKTQYPD